MEIITRGKKKNNEKYKNDKETSKEDTLDYIRSATFMGISSIWVE